MAYQFLHVETYSEHPKAVKGSKDHFNSAAQVLGEAARDPIYSEHVDCPLPPTQLRHTRGRVGLSAENPFKDFALLFSANDIRLLG